MRKAKTKKEKKKKKRKKKKKKKKRKQKKMKKRKKKKKIGEDEGEFLDLRLFVLNSPSWGVERKKSYNSY